MRASMIVAAVAALAGCGGASQETQVRSLLLESRQPTPQPAQPAAQPAQPGTAASGGVSFGAGSVMTLTPQDNETIVRECAAVRNAAMSVSVAQVDAARTGAASAVKAKAAKVAVFKKDMMFSFNDWKR